ncbi:MAG: 3-isopropylmalate dehydratase large subunit [Pseudomonadota bacterium]
MVDLKQPVFGKTLYEKIWDAHVVTSLSDEASLLYIDRHLVQEVSSPQAFEGLVERGITLRRPDAHVAVPDHAVPTIDRSKVNRLSMTARQVARLEDNARHFGIPYMPMGDHRHGIVHIIGPELGFTLPGTTLVCGDSHTSTHGAFGALAFGIGTSECECVFATQSLRQSVLKTMRISITGTLQPGVSVKDIILAIITQIGTDGAKGYAIEYAGETVRHMTMEERMTLCNMSIEAGARIGLVAPDDTTFAYLQGRNYSPKGAMWDQAVNAWRLLPSDADAVFDKEIALDITDLAPHVSWGTTPADCIPITGQAPLPSTIADHAAQSRVRQGLHYMDLQEGTKIEGTPIDQVFIGSCTNGRIEDLRRAAAIAEGRHVAEGLRAIVVPGSEAVRRQAEEEGLHETFGRAGFQWRRPGCSMCVAMNDDRLKPGERAASTSNRNFEGRQGPGGRTHLVSPEMAAAAAIQGCLTDVRTMIRSKA